MYHKVLVVGYLGSDPEMRYTPQGTPVTNFRMATTRKWNDAEGNLREETVWFRVTAWGKLAETVTQYLTKGRPALVEGTLMPDETGGPRIWTGQDGKPRASFEVRAQTVRFLPWRAAEPAAAPEPTAAPAQPADVGGEEEIPF